MEFGKINIRHRDNMDYVRKMTFQSPQGNLIQASLRITNTNDFYKFFKSNQSNLRNRN